MKNLMYYKLALEQMNIVYSGDINILAETIQTMFRSCFKTKDEIGPITDDLVELGLLTNVHEMYSCSLLGDELVETAAGLFVQAEKPNLLEKKCGNKKRVIDDEMNGHKDYLLECMKDVIPVKGITIDRTNYVIRLEKTTKGIKCIDVRNCGDLRIGIRKTTVHTINHFTSYGFTYLHGAGQTYFDLLRSKENIEKLVKAVLAYFDKGV